MNRKVKPAEPISAEPERCYTIPEVAKALNVSRSTVQAAIDQGKLRTFRLHTKRNMVRISERAYQEFLRKSEAEQPRPDPFSARQIANEVQ